MKKNLSVMMSLLMALFLSACVSFVDTDTAKSAELSNQYDFYEGSSSKLRADMHITPEQADEVFLVLVSIGLDDGVTYISEHEDFYTKDVHYKVTWSGKTVNVFLKDGMVEKVTADLDILYPEEKLHNVLMVGDLSVKDVMNGTGDTVLGQYAYIKIPGYLVEKVTDYNLKEFAEERVEGSGYNWVSIFLDDDKGICFPGSSMGYAMYGVIDSDGSIIEELGVYTLKENGDFVYEEF